MTAKSCNLLTPDDIRNLWYSDAECQDAERQAREDAMIFLATTGSYHAALEQLLTQKCLTNDDEPASTLFSSRNQMAWEIAQVSKQARQEQYHPTRTKTTKRQNMYTTDVALRFVVDSPVRGLERSFVLSALDRLESCHLYNELVFGGMRRHNDDSSGRAGATAAAIVAVPRGPDGRPDRHAAGPAAASRQCRGRAVGPRRGAGRCRDCAAANQQPSAAAS